MIGIIAALDAELSGLVGRLTDLREEKFAGLAYYSGRLHGTNVVLCNCGVGKVNAAMHTQILIDRFGVDVIIQNGLAGSLSPDLGIGDVVIGSELVYHDMPESVIEEFGPLEKVYKADSAMIGLAQKAIGKCTVGRIATGDVFVSDSAVKAEIASRTGALCAEMEGCAVAHTAFLNGVPFIVMRTVSDGADESANVDFYGFIQQTAARSIETAEALVAELAGADKIR